MNPRLLWLNAECYRYSGAQEPQLQPHHRGLDIIWHEPPRPSLPHEHSGCLHGFYVRRMELARHSPAPVINPSTTRKLAREALVVISLLRRDAHQDGEGTQVDRGMPTASVS